MHLVKQCGCGASIDVRYDSRVGYRADNDRERYDALKQVEKFDRQHKGCRASTGEETK